MISFIHNSSNTFITQLSSICGTQTHPAVPYFLTDHTSWFVLVPTHPLVCFYVSQVHSLVGVTVKDTPYEINYHRTEVDWKVYIDF